MFGRDRDTHTERRATDAQPALFVARGGVSTGAVLTGVVVAFGAMFVLTAVISGILVGLGLSENLSPDEQTEVGIATGIGLMVAQLLSYMWGGYAAGRMSRGAGAVNGFLVALLGVVVGIAVGAIAAGIGATEDVRTPFNSAQLPADGEVLRWGAGLALASIAAMFLGATIGGARGSRWHRTLEETKLEEHRGKRARSAEPETIDLRDGRRTPDARSDPAITSGNRRE